jgi:hypothetical protein
MSEQTIQQDLIDVLYTFQCCLSKKAAVLINLDDVGSTCVDEEILKVKEMIIYFKSLKNQIISNENNNLITSCLTQKQIEKLIRKLKYYCKECCVDMSFLELEN